jgi:hypothetical protein
MKTFIVYLKGVEVGYIKASGHNAAEKKAQEKYLKKHPEMKSHQVSVVYTEL